MVRRLVRLAMLCAGFGEPLGYAEWTAVCYLRGVPKSALLTHRPARHPRTARALVALSERLA
jgi:hypothetical protein